VIILFAVLPLLSHSYVTPPSLSRGSNAKRIVPLRIARAFKIGNKHFIDEQETCAKQPRQRGEFANTIDTLSVFCKISFVALTLLCWSGAPKLACANAHSIQESTTPQLSSVQLSILASEDPNNFLQIVNKKLQLGTDKIVDGRAEVELRENAERARVLAQEAKLKVDQVVTEVNEKESVKEAKRKVEVIAQDIKENQRVESKRKADKLREYDDMFDKDAKERDNYFGQKAVEKLRREEGNLSNDQQAVAKAYNIVSELEAAKQKAQVEVDFRQTALDEGKARISKEVDLEELQSLKDELLKVGRRTKELQAVEGKTRISKEVDPEELQSLKDELLKARERTKQLQAVEGESRTSKEVDPEELQSLKDELLKVGQRTKELQARVGDETIDFKDARAKKIREIELYEQRVVAANRELASLKEDLRVAQKTTEQLNSRITQEKSIEEIRGEKQQEIKPVEERSADNEREKQYRIQKIEATKKREREEYLEMKLRKKETFEEDLFEQKQEQFEKEFEELDKFATRRGLIKLKEEAREAPKLKEEAREEPKPQEKAMGEESPKEEAKQTLEPGKAKPLFQFIMK